MIYTIQMQIDFDEDGIQEKEELEDYIKEVLETSAITINNFELIDVND